MVTSIPNTEKEESSKLYKQGDGQSTPCSSKQVTIKMGHITHAKTNNQTLTKTNTATCFPNRKSSYMVTLSQANNRLPSKANGS